MDVEEFQDRDTDYLDWVEAHPDGYVIDIGRSRRGYGRLHRATCGTITSRPPFTGPYIKIYSGVLTELDRWALSRTGAVAELCRTCRPLSDAVPGQQKNDLQLKGGGYPPGRQPHLEASIASLVMLIMTVAAVQAPSVTPSQTPLRNSAPMRSRSNTTEPLPSTMVGL